MNTLIDFHTAKLAYELGIIFDTKEYFNNISCSAIRLYCYRRYTHAELQDYLRINKSIEIFIKPLSNEKWRWEVKIAFRKMNASSKKYLNHQKYDSVLERALFLALTELKETHQNFIFQ